MLIGTIEETKPKPLTKKWPHVTSHYCNNTDINVIGKVSKKL